MISSSLSRVGIAGLGIIGSRVAANLRARGFVVRVWNRTPQPDAEDVVDTPADLAREADVVQIFITDGQALTDVIEQMEPELCAGKVVVNCSTVSLRATKEAARMVEETGAEFLDAPFTGSRDAAAAGALSYYVGGEEALLDRMRPVFEASGQNILYAGEMGAATVLKIATNMISASTVQVLAEALGVVTAAGLSGEKFMAAMEINACASALTRMKLPSMISGDFTPHFSLKNMFKDSRIAIDLAETAGIELPVLTAASDCMGALMMAGRGNEDYSVLAVNFLREEPGKKKTGKAKS